MSRPPLNVDALLEASLRRIGGALEHNRSQYASMVEQSAAAAQALNEQAALLSRLVATFRLEGVPGVQAPRSS